MRVTDEGITNHAHIITSVKVLRQLFNDQAVRQVLREFSVEISLISKGTRLSLLPTFEAEHLESDGRPR